MIFAVPSHSTNRAAPSSVMDFSPGTRADLAFRYEQLRTASPIRWIVFRAAWRSDLTFPVLFPLSALFTVMCYNVLCDKYATRQLYGYCPSWALSWDYRKKNIMQEILGCNADIISLQVSARVEVSISGRHVYSGR